MNNEQAILKSFLNTVLTAVDSKIQQYDIEVAQPRLKNYKPDGSQIKPNTLPGSALKDGSLKNERFYEVSAAVLKAFTTETVTLVADWVKSGQLDTNLVNIYSGDNLRFLMNGTGLYAFHTPDGGTTIDNTTYVRYYEEGVELVKNNIKQIEIGWSGMKFFEVVDGVSYESLIADSTGKLWLKRKLTVGADPYDAIYIDGESGNIGTSMYSSGALGRGWRLSKTGDAEFNNIRARGTLTATSFSHEHLSAVAGSLYISPSLISDSDSPITTVDISGADYYQVALTFPFTGENHYASGMDWTSGDLVSIQGLIEVSTNIYEVRDFRCKISAFTSTGCTLLSVEPVSSIIAYDESTGAPFDAGVVDLSSGVITPNSAFIFMGTIGSGGEILRRGILISASEPGSPYINIYDSTEDDTMPKVRLGNLSGISDTTLPSAPSGYGLYSTNAFLRGTLVANNGIIGGLKTDAHTMTSLDGTVGIADGLPDSPAGEYVFWAGNSIVSEAPYRVNKLGHLFIGNEDGDHLSFDGSNLDMQVRSLTIKTETATLAMGDVINSITEDIGDLQDFREDQQSIIYLDGAGVHVGERGFLAQTIVASDGIHLLDNNGAESASFADGKAYIQNAEFTSTMQIGNFQYKAYSSGRVAIRKT